MQFLKKDSNLKKLEKIDFIKQIKIQKQNYLIKVTFSNKKSSSVSLKENELQFRLSSNLNQKDAKIHFEDLLNKISKKISKNPIKKSNILFKEIFEKSSFKFANQIYKFEHKKINLVEFDEKNKIFFVNPKINLESLEKYVIKVLIYIYTKKVKEYVLKLNSKTYNYDILDIELKNVKSKWGHCTNNNKIMLNLKLLNAPIKVFNYVIFHELSHIKHKNHSKQFWQEVQRFCPDYKIKQKQLKENPPNLFEFA